MLWHGLINTGGYLIHFILHYLLYFPFRIGLCNTILVSLINNITVIFNLHCKYCTISITVFAINKVIFKAINSICLFYSICYSSVTWTLLVLVDITMSVINRVCVIDCHTWTQSQCNPYFLETAQVLLVHHFTPQSVLSSSVTQE